MGRQFNELRFGDRYFYTNTGVFTPGTFIVLIYCIQAVDLLQKIENKNVALAMEMIMSYTCIVRNGLLNCNLAEAADHREETMIWTVIYKGHLHLNSGQKPCDRHYIDFGVVTITPDDRQSSR